MLKSAGIAEKTLDRLRKYYEDSVTPGAAAAYNDGGVSADGYVAEIGKWIEIVTVMQEKSPEDYRNSAPEELEIDSAFAIVLAEFLQSGGTEDMLAPYADKLGKIDLDRSMRLSKAYREAHPELGQ